MSLTYLSGIGAPKRKSAPPKQAAAATPKAKALQKVVNKTPTAKLIKAVSKQSNLTAQKIQKNRAQTQQRRAFKKANEAAIIKQNDLEAQEAYKLPPLKVEVDNEEVQLEAPDMSQEEQDESSFDDLGIIYPEMAGTRKIKKAKKQSTKAAKSALKTGSKQQRKNIKTSTKANKKNAKANDTAARSAGRRELLNKGLDTATKILNKKLGIEETAPETAAPTAAPEKKEGFLSSIPTPVKWIGGGALLFLGIKALK